MPRDVSVIRKIHRLRQLGVAELRVEWERVFGEPATSRNRDYLWRRLAWRVQADAHGGLSADTRRQLGQLAPTIPTSPRGPRQRATVAPVAKPSPGRDPQLPVAGTVIARRYKGRDLRLIVREDGFELDGTMFQSLSEAARHVTGSRWNGRLFWGLTERKRRR